MIWSDEYINETDSFVTETGEVEKWIGKGKEVLQQNVEETIKYLQSLKK
jgi:hypothetical protein